jgi:hypothetical protein
VAGPGARRVPGVRAAIEIVAARFAKERRGEPDAHTRAKTVWHAVAVVYGGAGRERGDVHLTGINGYDFTARILAWGAARAAAGLDCNGSVGPAEAFGLTELEAGCAAAGLRR